MSFASTRLRYLAAELKTGPFGSALSAEEYVDDGIPLINPSDLRSGRIYPESTAKVPELVAERMAPYRLRKGDLVLARRGELGRYGLVGRAEHGYLCGTGSLLVRPNARLNSRFLGYLLETQGTRDWLSLQSVGSTMENLSETILARLPIPSVPSAQQECIANFLDEQTARIDALIAEKERLLLAINDFAKAKVSQLLATGCRTGQTLETTSVFVPEAPTNWRVAPLKRAIRGISQGWSPQCENRPAEASEWGVLKVGCVNGLAFNPEENKALPSELEADLSCVLRKNDVLISRANTRELVGLAALVEQDHPNLLLCDKLYRLDLRGDWVTPAFVVLALRAENSRHQIELGASGASSSMQNISQEVLRDLVMAFPPLDEQHEIVERARQVLRSVQDLDGHVTTHIARLREYRSSLISAAVTGQLNIDDFQARQLEAA